MKKRQFGRPRVAVCLGAAFTIAGVAALFFEGVGPRTGLPVQFWGAVLIVLGLAMVGLAIRQLRSERR